MLFAPEYKTKIQDDPIALLEAIKTLMHDPIRAQYPIISAYSAQKLWYTTRQHDEERLNDFAKRYKQNLDRAKSYIGKGQFDYFVEQSKPYQQATDDQAKQKLTQETHDAFIAWHFMQAAHYKQYGILLTNFATQYSLGNNQYPRTFNAALDVLSNHKLDAKYYKQRKRDKDQLKIDAKQEDTNPSLDAPSNAQKSKEYRCHCCGSRDHNLKKCPELKTRPRDRWWAEKQMNK